MTAEALTLDDSPANRRRAWRNVIVLIAAQSIIGAQMSMIFITAGLAGAWLAPNRCLATLPVSAVMLGSALSARWLSRFMAQNGRQTGFSLACIVAALGAAIAFIGLQTGSFIAFTGGCALIGCYMSAQGFYRFAAVDVAPQDMHPRVISLVQAGGLASALIGPRLAATTAEATAVPFALTFAIVAALNLSGPLFFAMLDIPRPSAPRPKAQSGEPTDRASIWRDPRIVVAMICAMVSYALMNLVMTSTPLAMIGCGFGMGDASNVTAAHMIAMFAPAFFTGNLISRFGAEKIVATGLLILAAGGGVALSGVDLSKFYIALILVGLGWNFGFIGATAMLTEATPKGLRASVQGLNDTLVFGGVFIASLSSGGLMGCLGGTAQQGWSAVNMAMLPFLILAGGALIWLTLRPRETR